MGGRGERLARLRALLADRRLDAVLISHPSNRFWLSGYSDGDVAPNGSGGVLLIDPERAILLTSPNNTGWAAAEAPDFDVRPWQRPWPAAIAATIKEQPWRTVGFEDEAILFAMHRDLSAA